MCGIAVFLGSPADPIYGRRRAMLAKLHHRGPDSQGQHEIDLGDDRVLWFGHARLSILDLSEASRQPMVDAVTGNVLAYNGEIYNYRSLVRKLEGEGVQFQTGGDTEVVLAAYRIWGRSCVEKFRGMYAFVLWDADAGELVAARDPFGIKPLYRRGSNGSWLFCSEVRPILEATGGSGRVDPVARSEYFYFGAVHSPRTLIEGVESVPQGRLQVYSRQGVMREETAGEPEEVRIYDGSWTSLQNKARHRFAQAVERHMVSDVPVGLFLSGGQDSSMLAAVLAEDLGKKPECYTVVFRGRDEAWDESSFARRVSSQWGLTHVEIQLREEDVLHQVEAGLRAMDQPTIDGTNTFIVSSAVRRRGGKVALSGLGADELLGGYSKFRKIGWLQRAWWAPGWLRQPVGSLLQRAPPFSKAARIGALIREERELASVYGAFRQVWPTELLQPAVRGELEPPRFREASGLGTLLERISRLEFDYYLADVLLRDADVMGMAHSLEIRVPFLDTDWVRFVRGIVPSRRFGGDTPKAILAETLLAPLGPEFRKRPKAGFVLPLERWLRGPLQGMARNLLQDDDLAERLGFQPRVVADWSNAFFQDKSVPWSRFWSLVVYFYWAAQHDIRG